MGLLNVPSKVCRCDVPLLNTHAAAALPALATPNRTTLLPLATEVNVPLKPLSSPNRYTVKVPEVPRVILPLPDRLPLKVRLADVSSVEVVPACATMLLAIVTATVVRSEPPARVTVFAPSAEPLPMLIVPLLTTGPPL